MFPARSSHGPSRCLAVLIGLWCLPARGIEIREYDPARHDRFTGEFESLEWNETAWFQSPLYTGVGWSAQASENKQFALVSPIHVVCATHFPPSGNGIRFMSLDGTVVQRTVAGWQVVQNGSGDDTDLALITLSAPILPEEGVLPSPYLNLPAEADYVGKELVAFGRVRKAGRTAVEEFGDFTQGAIGLTRVMHFHYDKDSGDPDDAYLASGDSGSPTFSMESGEPALVGTHTAATENTHFLIGIDTFVPAYIAELDAFMADQGYRMRPVHLTPVELEAGATGIPEAPWQAEPGSVRFDLENPSAEEAGNVRIKLTFLPGQEPDAITAPDWIPELSGPEIWSFRRTSLAPETTSSVTASWNTLPIEPLLAVELEHRSDGAPALSENFQIPLRAGYAAWSHGLPDPAPTGDPDHDGLVNLLEYALGGDPGDGASAAAGGKPASHLSVEDGETWFEFPARTDAEARGLLYAVEISDSLETGSWNAIPPEDLLIEETGLTPPIPGFILRRVKSPAGQPRQFLRLKVTLEE